MEKEGLPALIKISKDKSDPKRFDAIKLIAAYAYGKPTEYHEHSGNITLESLIAGSMDKKE